MSVSYLLDTNIVSALLKPQPNPRLLQRMADAQNHLVTASLVVHELWFGAQRLAHGRKRELIEGFIRTHRAANATGVGLRLECWVLARHRARPTATARHKNKLCGWTNRGGLRGQPMHYGYRQSA
ncbi:MAG: hypothetical protein CM15mP120_17220 [Pseudomonadota bacterium]|nr:MAG: hypothetical protein CM15mP120_17220 [Pseudomonadota bacterium]